MRILWMIATAVAASAAADAETPREKELSSLIAKYCSAEEEQSGSDKESTQSPWELYPPSTFLDFARSQNDDASLKACEFVIRKFYIHDARYAAIDLAFRQHRKKKLFPQFVGNLVYWYDLDQKVDTYLADLAESQDPVIRAIALYHQARLIIDRRNWLQDDPERYARILPDRMIEELQSAKAKHRARQLLARVVQLNPNVKYLQDSDKPLVAWAKEDLLALEQLQSGDRMPEVSGTDSDGRRFSVSDYRGKIVVITFWAGWCAGCMHDLPHEIEFVDRLKDRPLVWLGVNGDKDLSTLKALEAKHEINFRSWHDGLNGPIAEQFAVRGWPAMWVVDQTGVIRYRSGASVDLELAKPAIEALVAKLETHGLTKKRRP